MGRERSVRACDRPAVEEREVCRAALALARQHRRRPRQLFLEMLVHAAERLRRDPDRRLHLLERAHAPRRDS